MPSRNSVNTPKLAAKQSRKSSTGQYKRLRRLAHDNSSGGSVSKTESAKNIGGILRGRIQSNKRAKKEDRNKRYIEQREQLAARAALEQLTRRDGSDLRMLDEADEEQVLDNKSYAQSRTQTKKLERERLFAADRVSGIENVLLQMDISMSGRGTTLGGPAISSLA
ncbi:uncharacterized protein V1516DRAFT_688173 [Lipomyces oligophaga]|uniref:uncharacterized protein n=1 Tax=Lipomyces oligophaga TaxID=45792 RepID=UPI0034CED39A